MVEMASTSTGSGSELICADEIRNSLGAAHSPFFLRVRESNSTTSPPAFLDAIRTISYRIWNSFEKLAGILGLLSSPRWMTPRYSCQGGTRGADGEGWYRGRG